MKRIYSNHWSALVDLTSILFLMEKPNPKIYTTILFLPALGLFLPNQDIIDYAHFLLIIALIGSSFACYHLSFKSETLNILRKCLGCLSTALLITYLSA